MARRILCICEGEKNEPLLFRNIHKTFFDISSNEILICSYGNDIYELFDALKDDEFLDIVEVLKEVTQVEYTKNLLENITRESISDVYLFFDLEFNDPKFSTQKLNKMLTLFNEETEQGKLYINYPMLEALRHLNDPRVYNSLTLQTTSCIGKIYKQKSAGEGHPKYNDYRKLSKNCWDEIIFANSEKARLIVNRYLNKNSIAQLDILTAQENKIKDAGEIYILSSIPLFIKEYFG